MKPVEVTWNPALTTGQDGKRYAISGSVWVAVPPGTTREELPMYMVVRQPKIIQQQADESWQVSGSTGSKYTVRLRSGQWSCSCAGFGGRQKCKHVEEKQAA